MSAETLAMIFDQYDTDIVGYLDRVAFEQFLIELGRSDTPPDQLERCFSIVDRNLDGRVSKENFIKYVPYLYEVDFNPPQRRTHGGKGNRKSMAFTKPGDPATFFTKVKKLGKGSYGVVYKAVDIRSDEIVALKIIDIEGSEEQMEDVQREVKFMANCNSPYIVKYYGSYLRGAELWISMEFIGGGSVLDMLKRQPLTESYAKIILRDTLKGLEYLHGENKMHRDIKAANILLVNDGSVKLADFGVAASLYQTVAVKNTFAGTPLWMAPEVIQQRPQTYAVDIWSLGITAIEMAKGVPPKFDMHPMQVLFSVPDDPPPKLEGNFSSDFKSFVATCLQKDAARRPTASALLKHPFLTSQDSGVRLAELIEQHEIWQETQIRLSRVSMAIDQEIKELTSSQPDSFWNFESQQAAPEEPDVIDKEEEAKELFDLSMIDLESELGIVLKGLNLLHLAKIFKDNDIDLDAFLLLEETDLKDLGIKLGSRKKLLHMIPVLRRELGFSSPGMAPAPEADPDVPATPPPVKKVVVNTAALPSAPPEFAAVVPPVPTVVVSKVVVPDAPRARPENPEYWNVTEVGQWLKDQKLEEHVNSFVENAIDGEALKNLELDSLKELGLKLVGERVKFLAAVKKLFRPAVPASTMNEKSEDGYYSDGESIIDSSSETSSLADLSHVSISQGDFSSDSVRERLPSDASTLSPKKKRGTLFKRSSFAKRPVDPKKQEELEDKLSKLQEQQKKESAGSKRKSTAAAAVLTEKHAAKLELKAPNIAVEELKSATYSGWLQKQGGLRKTWKKRWMVLQDCVLYYFSSNKNTKAKGAIMLPSYNLWIAGELKKKFTFKLQHVSARTYYFQAENYEQMKNWMNYMHAATKAYDAGSIEYYSATLARQENETGTTHSSDEEDAASKA